MKVTKKFIFVVALVAILMAMSYRSAEAQIYGVSTSSNTTVPLTGNVAFMKDDKSVPYLIVSVSELTQADSNFVIPAGDVIRFSLAAANSPVDFKSKDWSKVAAKLRGVWGWDLKFQPVKEAPSAINWTGSPKSGVPLNVRLDGISGRTVTPMFFGIGRATGKPYVCDGLRFTFWQDENFAGETDQDHRDFVLRATNASTGIWLPQADQALVAQIARERDERYPAPSQAQPVITAPQQSVAPVIDQQVDQQQSNDQVRFSERDLPTVEVLVPSDPKAPSYFRVTFNRPFQIDLGWSDSNQSIQWKKNVTEKATKNGEGQIFIIRKTGRKLHISDFINKFEMQVDEKGNSSVCELKDN